jgi:pyruvate kinase
MDDGLIEVMTLEVQAPRIRARVVHGGELKSHKGLNLPGVHVSAPSITDKDEEDIRFAIEQGVEYLALSFVRRAEDIEQLRKMIPADMLIIAKIEKDIALRNIESILRAADGVMVARGDLGVELPFEEVPLAQKRIIALANRFGKPVITATQMLESMVVHARPTRAEASDVANAILDGTDAIMLSAETATGAFPRLAVAAMSRIIREVESHPLAPPPEFVTLRPREGPVKTELAIAVATVAATRMVDAPCVVVITKSGSSARIVASQRPNVAVVALTDIEKTSRQLALVWGAIPVLVPHCNMYADMVRHGLEAVKKLKLANKGDRIVITAGVPFDIPGTTNTLKVEIV